MKKFVWLLVITLLLFCWIGNANAAITLKSIVASPTTITITAPGQPITLTAVAVIERNPGTNPGDTDAVTITWGLQGGGGASYGGGTITIPSGLHNNVGTGTANFTVPPGTYTVFGSLAGTPTNGNQITVVLNTPPTPTRPVQITQVESDPIPATSPLVYRKTEVKVFGTCEFAGQTIEVQLDGSVVGSILTTGTNWAYTVTIPADENFHTITAITGNNLVSNAVQVKVDIRAPQFNKIIYSPSTMPFGVGDVNLNIEMSEPVNVAQTNLSIILPDGKPVPITPLNPVPAGATSTQTFTAKITIGKDTSGNPTVNGTPTTNGTCVLFGFTRDLAKPDGNPGTQILEGSTFTINVSGPSSSGAVVIIEDDKVYTNSRTLNFRWRGFSHGININQIDRYWYIAVKPPTAPPAGTSGWSDGGGGGSDSGTGTLNVTDDGTWEVYVKAQDKAGNFSAPVKDSIIVDSIGPNLVAGTQQPPPGFPNGTDQIEISCVLSDALSGIDRNTVVMTINGTPYGVGGTSNPNASAALSCVTTGTAGQYKLIFRPYLIGLKYPAGTVNVSVMCNDMVGNPLGGTAGSPGSPVSWSFTVIGASTQAPIPKNPQPVADKYYNAKRPIIKITLEDEDKIDTNSVILNVVNGTSFMTFNVGPNLTLTEIPPKDNVLELTPPTDFTDGTTTVTVRAKDKLGNEMAPYTWTFYIDTTPPAASNPQPTPGTIVTSFTPIISLKLEDLSGVDQRSDNLTMRINFTSTTNPASSFSREYKNDDPASPGLSYNPSTKMLVFNPTIAGITFGVGSVEVILVKAQDKAVAPLPPYPDQPNILAASFKWSFLIGTDAGPYVDLTQTTPKPPASPTQYFFTNQEPLTLRIMLVDDDLINHSSLLIDVNGRTFRDGDSNVSWITNATNEILVIDFTHDSSLLRQGTNTVMLREANDRTGKPLQNKPVNLSFLYDTIGPVASDPNPSDGGVIYDLNSTIVKCKLTDNYAGIERATLELREDGTLIDIFGTDSTPVNLIYDRSAQELVFKKPTPYKGNSRYTFTLIPPPSPTSTIGTVDKAGNGLGKVSGSPATRPFSWTLSAPSSTDVVELISPEHQAIINPHNSSFRFEWKPLSGATRYKLEIADRALFTSTTIVATRETNQTYYIDDTLANSLEHGKMYFWRVSALNPLGMAYGTSEQRQFTVDKLAPQAPRIVGIIDYLGLNPKHEYTDPLNKVSYVKQRRIKVKVAIYEGHPSTVGYKIEVGYIQIVDANTTKYIKLGENTEVHGYDTNEIDMTFPDQDGEYRIVAYVVDKAGNRSLQSEPARVYLNRKIPEINSIIITDPSPNSNGYITSGKVKFEVLFNTPIDMAPLSDYFALPSIKFDPKSGEGTGPIELTDLTVTGKSVTGYGYIPYGQGSLFDGMADLIISGFMDRAWNVMKGGTVTYYKHFEIDTAPGFNVKTFLNPVDEKNVLINIQASETLLFTPACYLLVSNGNIEQIPVYAMAKNLYAASTYGTVGENNIRISGLDTRNNIGYWPPPDVIREGRFLMAEYKPTKNLMIQSENMGISLEIPKNALNNQLNVYVFKYNLEYLGNDYLLAVNSKNNNSNSKMIKNNISNENIYIKTKNNKIIKSTLNSKQAEIIENYNLKTNNTFKMINNQIQSIEPELEQISDTYDISPLRNLKVNGKISIDCNIPNNLKPYINKMSIYYSNDGILWEKVNSKYENQKFSCNINKTGIYGVFIDNKKPSFLKSIADNNIKLDTLFPNLYAYVCDFGSEINSQSAKVIINGIEYKANYDEKEQKIYYQVKEPLNSGEHEIIFEISDNAGNVSRQVIKLYAPAFKPEITNMISYPNPAKRNSNPVITFNVNGTLNNPIEAKVYIYDINGNKITELIPIQNGNNFKAIWFNLLNDNGQVVANGIYFYKIKVNCADINIEKFGKIAVLK